MFLGVLPTHPLPSLPSPSVPQRKAQWLPASKGLVANKTASLGSSKTVKQHSGNARTFGPVKRKSCLDSSDSGFICAGVSNVGGYKINV